MHRFDVFERRAGFEGDGEGEGIRPEVGGGEEAVETEEGVGEEAMANEGGDHGIIGEDVVFGNSVEGESGGGEIAQAGVEVEEVGGEENVG